MTGPSHIKALPSDDFRTIAFSERDVDDATRLLSMIAGRKPEPQAMPPPIEQRPAHTGSGPLKLCARRIYEGRKRRSAHFGQQMFNEPAWEMLLILYLEDSGERQLQARLDELSGASRSTGNRWIDFLVRKGLAKREEHPTDKRRNFVTLSEKGRTLLELYLSETCGKDREA